MNTKRPYYPTKAAWAAAMARQSQEQANNLPDPGPAAGWRRYRARAATRDRLLAAAARYGAMAERYAEQGI